MINKLNLLHYLSEKTYKSICRNLGLDEGDSKVRNNHLLLSDELVCRIHPFNILYNQFGHVWFLSVGINFQKFQQAYENFEKVLFGEYEKLFGKDAMSDFPVFQDIYCDYIEYSNVIKINSAEETIRSMAASGCLPEQLEESRWEEYKKPHGTIEFCVSRVDDTHMKTLARCHGTALQKRIKDTSLHHMGAGIKAAKMVSEETESEIMNWLYSKQKITIIR
ncbi:hypothetical protein HNQ56_002272 [Anaerotaenia torta]|uniref:hypothetical protein n=1 Tax=Anaerotaenia torta TaxID=433293 RepID=UPI003D1F3BA4